MSGVYSTNLRDTAADVAEAVRNLKLIEAELKKFPEDPCSDWERGFLASVSAQLDIREWISEKQLFRLRDLKNKLTETSQADSRAARFKRVRCARNRYFDLGKAERAARATARGVHECIICAADQEEEVWHVY